jgi:hypothetical protein
MDDLMLKADIAADDLSLKSYSDRLLQTVLVLSLKIFSDRQYFYRQIIYSFTDRSSVTPCIYSDRPFNKTI